MQSGLRTGTPEKWFSRGGPWTRSINITWKLIRKAHFQAILQTPKSETLAGGRGAEFQF